MDRSVWSDAAAGEAPWSLSLQGLTVAAAAVVVGLTTAEGLGQIGYTVSHFPPR